VSNKVSFLTVARCPECQHTGFTLVDNLEHNKPIVKCKNCEYECLLNILSKYNRSLYETN